jgi:predicted Rossmann fold nucleotide-binding protein DprA/Smf involved in DNA uptake
LAVLKPDEAAGVDTLSRESGLTAAETLSALLELQMAGACVELPGARYARKGAKEQA